MGTPNNGINGTLATGLLAHWDFTDGRLTDVSGNGNDLQSYNFVRSIDDDADGNYADAIKCNGSGYLYLDFEWINNYPGFTISMMFKDNEDTGVYPSALMTICNDLFDDNPPNFSARIGEGGWFQTYAPQYGGWTNYMTELPEASSWGMMIVEIYKKADGLNYAKINITSRYGNGMILDGEILITRENPTKLIFGAAKIPGKGVLYSGASIDEIRFYDKLLTSEQKAEIFEMGANYTPPIIVPATPNEGINGTLGTDLLAHWSFDNNLLDSSGAERHLTNTGTQVSFVADKDSPCVSVPMGAILTSPIMPNTNATGFTITIWFKHDPLYGRPIFKIRMFSDVEGTDMVDVQSVNTSMQDSGTQRIIMNLSRTIGDAIEGWNCLIVRTSGNGAPFGDVYLNDVLIQAVGFEDNIWNSIQLVIEKNIGEQNDLTDEIRVVGRVLTDAECHEVYTMGVNYTPPIMPPATPNEGINGTLNNNLLAHWDFFQERLIDVSGNGHVLVRDVSATTPIETRKNMEGTEENDFSIICKKDANLLSHEIDSSVITSGSNKEFSISFWFKKHISTTSLENMLSIGGGTWYGLSFLLENYAPRISIGLLGGEVLHLTNTLYALSNLDFDFHNISMICTTENINKRVAVFLDGVLIINAVIPTEINWSTDPLKVGNSMNVLPQHTDVTIDEIRIYNRALDTGLNLATASIGDEASSEIGEIFTMQQYYLPKCSNPISSMPENIYNTPISIYLNCDTVGAEIRYTLDGSDVDINSTLYTGEIAIENSTTLKIMAFKPGLAPSDQVTYFYAIEASNNQKNLTQSNHKFVNITSGVFRITTLGLSTNGDVNIFSLDLTIADAISLNLQNLLEGTTDIEKIFNKHGSLAGETYIRKNIVERELKFSLKDDLMLITDEQKDLDTSSNRNILMAMLDGGTFKIDGVQYNVIGINGNEKTITYNNKIFETLFHVDKIISLPDIIIEHDSKFFNGTIKNPRLHLYKNNSLAMTELLIEYDETTKEGFRIANSCLSNILFTEDNSCNKFDITEKQISDIKSISEFFINDMNYINALFSYNLGNRTLFYSKINDSVINNTTLEIDETDLNLATHSIVSYNTILPRSSNIDDIVVCFLNTSKKFVIAKKNGTDTWKLLKNNIFEIEQYSDTYENAIYNIYNFDIVEEKFIKR